MSDGSMTWPNATFLAWDLAQRDLLGVARSHAAAGADRGDLSGSVQHRRGPCLDGSLHRSGIDIYAMQDGDCWDILWNSDISPAEFASGWGCRLCIDAWKNACTRSLRSIARPRIENCRSQGRPLGQ